MSENDELASLEARIVERMRSAPERPKLRLITTADLPPKPARCLTDEERDSMCQDVRIYCGVYPIEPYVRKRMKGCVMPEELCDTDLREVHEYVARCVQSFRDGIGLDEAGLL